MPSSAHEALSVRLQDIDQLMAAHAAVGGPERGRRFDVEALNRASVLLLSAHLEGYLEDLMREALIAVQGGLSGDAIVARFANPTTGEIDKLFAVIGMEKPCSQISWRKAGNQAVKANLNELVGRRNRIAHGAEGVTVYKAEVERFRRYVTGFAQRFDELVRRRVAELAGSTPWPAD
jgi:hypothetical protein